MPVSYTHLGKMPDYKYFSKNGMLKGRYFTKKEYLAGQPLAIIGEKDAVRIFGSTDIVGKELDFKSLVQNLDMLFCGGQTKGGVVGAQRNFLLVNKVVGNLVGWRCV